MASSTTGSTAATEPGGAVLFAYDGSPLAALAIEQAAAQLAPGRDALIVCVWQTGDVGFVPPAGRQLNAAQATEVRDAAQDTAARGALLAANVGFRPQSIAIEAAPTWRGIIAVAEQHEAGLIVLGTHHRSGLAGHLLGSVTSAVIAHTTTPVLVTHERS